jgi:preprotein translocase subunit YajC
MEPMNIGVLVVGVVLIVLSVFLVVRDQRKRERNKKLAALREKATRYSDR